MYRNIRRISIRKTDLLKARNQIKSERRKKRDVDYDTYSHATMCRMPASSTTTLPSINKISPMFMNITTTKRNKNNEKRKRRCPALWIFMCPLLCMLTLLLIGILTYSIIAMNLLKRSTITTTTTTLTTITSTTTTTTSTTITTTTTVTTTTTTTTATTATTVTTITITSTTATGTTVIATTTITTTIATTIAATSTTMTTVNTCGQPICSFSPDNTRYPNTCDCTQFFICSNYVWSIFNCPGGTNFDPILQICNWPASVTCATG